MLLEPQRHPLIHRLDPVVHLIASVHNPVVSPSRQKEDIVVRLRNDVVVPLEQTINLLSTNVADYFKLSDRKGRLHPDKDADFALIDLWNSQIVRAEKMHSKGKYTPFDGLEFNAAVNSTFVRGKMVSNHREESNVNVSYGQLLG